MFRVSLRTQTFSTASDRIWNALIVKFNLNVPLVYIMNKQYSPISDGGSGEDTNLISGHI